MLQSVYGIDMGTSTIKIYNQKENTISKEKNMIAVRNGDTVFAVGNNAYEMYEKTPQNIKIISPMSNGRINDMLMTEAVLHTVLSGYGGYQGYQPTIYFSVPMDMTEIEKRAYSSIARKGRMKRSRIFLVEKPIADAIAIGIPIHHTKGSMIVNIGAESSELSIIADSHVIISRLVPIGGIHLNAAIVAGVRRRNNFIISRKTARKLKVSLTDLEHEQNEGRKVFGIDTNSGLPRDGVVSSYTVTSSVMDSIHDIKEHIRKFLERTPPQVRNAIKNDGIYLTGGSTQIRGLQKYLEKELECKIMISPYHEMSTIEGLKRIINQPELQHWAFVPNKKNR